MAQIQIIVGSPRQGAFGDKPAAWVQQHLEGHDDLDGEIIDLRDCPLPFFDQAPPAHTLREYPNAEVARLGRVLDRADGFIIVTPEYNHGYPASLKNAMSTPSSSGAESLSRSSAMGVSAVPVRSNSCARSSSS